MCIHNIIRPIWLNRVQSWSLAPSTLLRDAISPPNPITSPKSSRQKGEEACKKSSSSTFFLIGKMGAAKLILIHNILSYYNNCWMISCDICYIVNSYDYSCNLKLPHIIWRFVLMILWNCRIWVIIAWIIKSKIGMRYQFLYLRK